MTPTDTALAPHQPRRRSLFSIGADRVAAIALAHEAADPSGEVTAEQSDTLDAFQAEIAADEGRKLDDCLYAIHQLKAEKRALGEVIKQLESQKNSIDSAVERIKGIVKSYLERTGQKKVFTALGRPVWVQKGPTTLDFTLAVVPEDMPAEYKRVKPVEFNLAAILKDLRDGKSLDFARLVEGDTSVRFK